MNSSNYQFGACTIVAKNYISLARTLCESFFENHAGKRFFVLIIDEVDGYISAESETFELVKLEDLKIPNVLTLAMKYDITEFSTSVKPFFLKHLFTKYGFDNLLYLDPDILVTQSLQPLVNKLDNDWNILLTPHLDADYPNDGLMPNDSHIMRSGIFNLGFIGLKNSKTSIEFLDWWQAKLYDKCYVDVWAGYMVDQKFIDYAFVLFEAIRVVKDVGYNVAYWNIHSRYLTKTDEGWLCNGEPLRFFHFSNYKPHIPNQISGHQTRFAFADRPDLEEIFLHYRQLLIKNGYESTYRWPYTWGKFKNGKTIDKISRGVFNETLATKHLPDPFDSESYPLVVKLKIAKRKIVKPVKIFFRRLIPGF